MPTIITTRNGLAVASNLHARRQQEAKEARDAARADLAAQRADTTTPLFPETIGRAPLATVPEPPAAVEKPARRFALQTTIAHRGRAITIHAEGMTLDQFCDLLDERQYHAPPLLSAPLATADDLPDGYKLCQKHRAPMRPRNKQNDNWHSHNVGTAEHPLWCKGYRGSDSPGYEVD